MVKALIFDFWGTVVENGTYSPIRQTYKILNPRMPFGKFVVIFEEEFMTRPFEEQSEGFQAVCEALNVEASPELIDQLVGLWNKNRMLAKPFPEALEVLQELRKSYKLALVSNTDSFIDQVMQKFELKKYFDVVVFSFDVGALKTNPSFYQEALRRLKVDADDALVIGDSLQTDIRGAEAAGIRAVLLDRNEQREFSPKIKTLSELPAFAGGLQ